MLSMFLFNVEDLLQDSLLILQQLLLSSESLDLLAIVVIFITQIIAAVFSLLTKTKGFAICSYLQFVQFLTKMISPLVFNSNQRDKTIEFLLLRYETVPQSFFIFFIGIKQTLLQLREIVKEFLLSSFEFSIQLFIVSLQIATFFLAFQKDLISLGNGLLESSFSFLPSLHKQLILIPPLLHLYLQLLSPDKYMLVLQILFPNLILSDNRGK